MSEERKTIDDLPEGTYLYEESSIRRVSQAIRTISGTKTKFSHRQQPQAIRDLYSSVHPSFTIGKALGGLTPNNHGTSYWGLNNNGPYFKNLIYSAYQNEKNIEIIFCVGKSKKSDSLNYVIHVNPYYISPNHIGTPGLAIGTDWVNHNSISTVLENFVYEDFDEVKIILDTYNRLIKIYINDVLMTDSYSISNDAFSYNSADIGFYENGNSNFWLSFPAYTGDISNPGGGLQPSNFSGCDIKYFRLSMEDWE